MRTLSLVLLLACSRSTAPHAAATSTAPVANEPVGVGSSAPAPPEDPRFAGLHDLLHRLGEADRWQGSLVLAKQGRVVFSHTEGTRAAGGAPIDAATSLRIGSISKVFTSVLIHQLAAEGKLSLDDPLSTWFPTVPNAERITIEQLLDHHSGLFNFTDDPAYVTWMEQETSRETLLEKISVEPSFEPGARGAYSNSNYVLLGWIAERAGGGSLSQLIEARIAEPLRLERTMLGDGIDPAANEARSQTWMGSRWEDATETHPSVPGGAGAIVSTPADLCAFAHALFHGDLLDDAGRASMKTLHGDYGRGLFRFPFHDRWSWGHTGGIDGFSSMLGYFEDDESCVAIVTHGSNFASRDTNALVVEALTVLNGGEVADPEVKPILKLDEAALQGFVGSYTSKDLPLGLRIFVEDGTLMGQGTGQPSFPLTALEPTVFVFPTAGVKIVFGPEPGVFTLHQGRAFRFVRSEGGAEPVE